MAFFSKKNILNIFILSLIIFSTKWFLSFYFFKESLDLKFIFDSIGDGKSWLPYIKYLSILTFDSSFEENINELRSVPIPVGSLWLHALLYKFFSFYGLLIIEIFAIFIFLSVYFNILKFFLDEKKAILFSLVLISFSAILQFSGMDNIQYLKSFDEAFFSLRPHRPIMANLYLYLSFYFMIIFFKNKNERYTLFTISALMGLTMASFYYFFLIQFLSLCLILLYKYKLSLIKYLIQNIKKIILSIIIFIIFLTPFIINLISHESDNTITAGLFELSGEKKIQILRYYFFKFISLNFIILFIFSLSILIFINIKKIKNYELTNIFFIIFLSSILAPLFFILLSPKSGLIYHFNNNILLCLGIYVFICFCTLINKYIKINYTKYNPIFIGILLFLYTLNQFNNFKNMSADNNVVLKRSEFTHITKIIKNDNLLKNNQINLLTFNSDFMIWAIMNKVKYLNVVNHMWVPKTHEMIENDLIQNLKFLKLNDESFQLFLINKFSGWRYFNKNVGDFFAYKYQANSLNTYKNSMDYSPQKMYEFIIKSPITLNQQIAIPEFEKKRLIKKFNTYNKNNFIEPDIIIINKKKNFLKGFSLDDSKYCNLFDGQIFTLYFAKKLQKCN